MVYFVRRSFIFVSRVVLANVNNTDGVYLVRIFCNSNIEGLLPLVLVIRQNDPI